ncbi:MAG: hypothetical protein HY954_10355 [Deltaproteobacteria bacterium]|nr:hypothetical protein [Deltaproteobacteria bacterium]
MRYPKNRPLALLVIFIMLPAVISAAVFFLAPSGGYLLSINDLLAGCLLALGISSAYVLTYPAVEALSPSLMMLTLIGNSTKGLSAKELSDHFVEDLVLSPRIKDLMEDGLVKGDGGYLRLTLGGVVLVRFFCFFRAFIGLGIGKG